MFKLHFNFRHFSSLLAIVFLLANFSLFFTKPVLAVAGINRTVNFQGKIVNNSNGTNVADSLHPNIVFKLYNVASGGTALWSETQSSVNTVDGIFRVALGSQTAFPANFNFNWDGLYLGVTVGGDSEMLPRIQMAAVPFAFNAQQVAGLTIQDSATGAASTSATLKIGTSGGPGVTPITVDLGLNNVTFNTGVAGTGAVTIRTSGATDLTLPAITGTLVATTLQLDITGNSKNITALAGLTINASGNINSATSGTLGIGTTANTTGLTLGNDSATSITLDYGTSGNLVLKKGAVALSCTASQKLTTDSNGYVSCGTDNTSAGAVTPFVELGGANGGIVYANNNTTDFLFGGQSTASATFHVFGNASGGTNPVVSIAAKSSSAGLVVNQSGLGDIFTASASGTPLFTVLKSGSLSLAANTAAIGFTGTGISSITTASNQSFAINPAGAGLVGINTDGITPLANFDVRTNLGTVAIASFSGSTSFAGLVVDNSGSGDIITASVSGLTKFVVRSDGSVGIGNGTTGTPTGYTLDVLGSARIGSSNTSGDDIFKATTSDFTQGTECNPTNYCVTNNGSGVDTVSTANNQVTLVTDLLTAGASVSRADGPAGGTGQAIGYGAIAFQRPDSKFVVVAGNYTTVTRLYDHVINSFVAGPNLMLNSGAGTNAFQRQNGKVVILMGGTNQTSLYDPTGSNNFGGIKIGPTLTGVVGAGSQVIRRSDGKFLVIHGGGVATSSIYDPTAPPLPPAPQGTDSGNFIAGPTTTAVVNTGSFAFETVFGKWVVGLGGNTNNWNTYDPVTGIFAAQTAWTGSAAQAGTFVIQRPDYTYLVALGGSNTTQIYNPQNNSFVAGPTVTGATFGAGAHAFQRSDGKWTIVVGGGSNATFYYDPNDTSGTGGGTTTGGKFFTDVGLYTAYLGNYGALTFQRPDGKYIVLTGGGNTTSTTYDDGWNTTGTWTSEAISTTKISTYSAIMWSGNPESANNNARLDMATTDVFVKTGINTADLSSPKNQWNGIPSSGGLIGGVANPAGAVQMQVTFNTPVRSYPQLVTSYINQSNVWGGEGSTFNRRSFLQPSIYTLRISNPLVQYGGLVNDPSYGRNFATSGAILEGVATDNNNQLNLSIIRNTPVSTGSATAAAPSTGAGFIMASVSANFGPSGTNPGAGANAIQIPNGKYIIMYGGGGAGGLLTRVYDPDANIFSAGPTLPNACNSGCHSFQLPDGKFFTVLGGAGKNTAIYDPAANVFYSGPTLTTAATSGSTSFQRPDGLFIILIGGSQQTNIYDPFLNQLTQGPWLPAGATTATFGAGTFAIKRPDGRILIGVGGAAITGNSMIYDQATNAFTISGTGALFTSGPLGGGAVPYQTPSGRWIVPRGTATTTTNIIDPVTNAIAVGPALSGNGAVSGMFWIPRPDGKALLALGNGAALTALYDPEANGGTLAMVAGPTLPCGTGVGSIVLQRPDGTYLLICGNSLNTAIIDAGWNLGGSYFSEQIFEPNLSSNTSLFWQNTGNQQGSITARYRTASSQTALGVTSWKDARNSGTALSVNTNDQWVQVRFDFSGIIPDAPGAKSRVWASSDTSEPVTYWRTVAAPTLATWKLMNTTTPTLLALSSNGSNAFRFSADGQAFTSSGGGWNSGGADLAERYTSAQDLQAGEVVVGDRTKPQNVVRSTDSYQSNIMGVVSTQPGFVAGAYTPDSYPIALVGRVPVKISTENGLIHSGDYLTSASIPGYAMKATVAGRVLGTALEDFDPINAVDCPADGAGSLSSTQCGTVTAFINLTNYNGQTVELAMADANFTAASNAASLTAGFSNISGNTGLNSYMNQVSVGDQNILAYLQSLREAGSAAFNSSEVFAGKVVAGEVISPNIIADLITAKTIRADHIEGLEILTNQLSALSNSVAVLSDATGSGQLTTATASAQLPSALNLSSLNINGLATVSGDLNIKGNGFIAGALNVLDNITTNNLLVSQFAYFINDVVFKGNVRFNNVPTFNNDTAGFAVIKQGQDTVQITFDNEYVDTPIVTASIALDKTDDAVVQKQLEDTILNGNLSYVITQRTSKGFTIRLNKPAPENINFSWVALSVQNAKTSGLTLPTPTPDPLATQSAAFQSILNQIEAPSPTPVQ